VIPFVFFSTIFAFECDCNLNRVEKIGFIVKGPMTSDYALKLKSIALSTDTETTDVPMYLIEFYNNDTSVFFVETKKGLICFAKRQLFYDSDGNLTSAAGEGGIPDPELIPINPGEKKIFLEYLPLHTDTKKVRLSYYVRRDSGITSRVVLQSDFIVD
jgi:hypothetical protein